MSNFHALKVVDLGSEIQLQVCEISDFTTWRYTGYSKYYYFSSVYLLAYFIIYLFNLTIYLSKINNSQKMFSIIHVTL